MFSLALYLLAVICSAGRTHAVPFYPDAVIEPQAEFLEKLGAEVEDGESPVLGEQRDVNNFYPLLNQLYGGRDSWNKGISQDPAPKETYDNMVDGLKEAVSKLAVVDRLRLQGFLRSQQSLPKTNKRACFWKYCVTN